MGTVGILEVTVNGGIGDQNAARNSLQSATGTRITGFSSEIDFFNSDGAARGRFGPDRPFLSDTNPGNGDFDDVNDISIIYRGTLRIPTSGDYTFNVKSDDGFTLAFDGGASPFTSISGDGSTAVLPATPNFTIQTYNGNPNGATQFFPGRGAGGDSLSVINLTAGDHPFTLTYHEGGGGAGLEVTAAVGAKTTVDSSFRLFGATGVAPTQVPRKLVTVGQWDYVRLNGDADGSNSLAEAITQYNNNVPAGNFLRSTEQTINFTDDAGGGNTGGHTPERLFPGNIVNVNEENFGGAGRASFTLAPSDAGRYTFMLYADDSNRFRILDSSLVPVPIAGVAGGAGVTAIDTNGDTINDAFQTSGCCSDNFGKFDLAAGTYTLEAIFNEQGGGAGFFVYGAQGDFNSFNPFAFQLAGENINDVQTDPGLPAGLQLVPEPTSTALLAFGALSALGLRRRRK